MTNTVRESHERKPTVWRALGALVEYVGQREIRIRDVPELLFLLVFFAGAGLLKDWWGGSDE